jgi:hydrogenase small subunit
VQAAKPNPTQAVPIDKVITDKPIIKVPGCPPIAEVMSGVVTYIAAFDRIPELDRQGRPKMFYSQRIHDKCYRRPHFDAGQFVEQWDDFGARAGYCLYKVGCKGPTTYNACSTGALERGRQLPDRLRPRLHRLLGRRLLGQGFVLRPPHQHQRDFGVEANADQVGAVVAGVVGAAIVAHAAVGAIQRAAKQANQRKSVKSEE